MDRIETELLQTQAMLSHAIGMVDQLQRQYVYVSKKVSEIEELAKRLERIVLDWEEREAS